MTKYIILGGGVAGVACFEELCRFSSKEDTITLISATPFVKCASAERVGRILESVDLVERPLSSLGDPVGAVASKSNATLQVFMGEVVRVDSLARVVSAVLADSSPVSLAYDKLCLCTGAIPRYPHPDLYAHPLMLGIRDLNSVATLRHTLAHSRRVLLVGNGGIALGIFSQVHNLPPTCDIHWAVRENYLGATFLDAAASDFLLATTPSGVSLLEHRQCATTDGRGEFFLGPSFHAGELDDSSSPASLFTHTSAEVCLAATSPGAGLQSVPLPKRGGSGGKKKRQRFHLPSKLEVPAAAAAAAAVSAHNSALGTLHLSDPLLTSPARGPDPFLLPQTPPLLPQWGTSLGPQWAASLATTNPGESSTFPVPQAPPASPPGGPKILIRRNCWVRGVRGVPGTPGDFGLLGGGGGVALGEEGGVALDEPFSPPEGKVSGTPSTPPYPLQVYFDSVGEGKAGEGGHVEGYDAIVWALGVTPHSALLPAHITRHRDGGFLVNPSMQTTDSCVFAAGDCASVHWPRALAFARGDFPLWFQMRTWTQARVAGAYAGRCMGGVVGDSLEEGDGGASFHCFAHTTSILGFKTVLLGAFNGQGLGVAWERAVKSRRVGTVAPSSAPSSASHPGSQPVSVTGSASAPAVTPWGKLHLLFRVTPGVEFVQVVVVGGRVVGALLLGETDLEETMENLILNGTDVRVKSGTAGSCATGCCAGETHEEEQILDLLNPEFDVEDYFD